MTKLNEQIKAELPGMLKKAVNDIGITEISIPVKSLLVRVSRRATSRTTMDACFSRVINRHSCDTCTYAASEGKAVKYKN